MHRAPARDAAVSLPEADRERLLRCLARAVEAARRDGGEVLVAFSSPVRGEVDPSAAVYASRRPGEPWFCIEQPERGHVARAGLGCAAALTAAGAERFAALADRWRALARDALCETGGDPDAPGPFAVGGFAFAPEGGRSPHWEGFDQASLIVPEISLVRAERGGEARVHLLLAALARPDDTAEGIAARFERRLGELRDERELPLLDPAPAVRSRVASAMPPEHYEAAVARAVELIRAGSLEKIVLAREVQVHAPQAYDPGALLGVLREEFPSCFCFCIGRGESTLLAASPELLVRREGQRVSTLALAGSARRSADPAVDDHLGEQLLRDAGHREEHAIVVRRIERTLRRHAVWVAPASEPALVRIANIQHLATPIRAQLAAPIDALGLAEILHPTPAVGGEPFDATAPLIPALEGLDRGWYTGPVGWTDVTGDGEFCVTLRCALLSGGLARCYASNGIVRDSDPAAELTETEVKLAALLPLLSG